MVLVETLILITIILFLLYKWSTATFNVLRERGIPHENPLPLIGNADWRVFVGRTSFLSMFINSYMKFASCKLYGIYNMRDPIIVLRDPELIKKIGIKDFESFPNRRNIVGIDDSILSKSLFAIQDRKWKDMRNTLTPSFTGSKMRLMFELINEVCIEGVKYIEMKTKEAGKNELDLEVKDYFTRFSNDVVASVAFGIKINSFQDTTNKFFMLGGEITQIKPLVLLKIMLYGLMPKIMKILRINLWDKKKIEYFNELVMNAISYRKQQKIIRPDMIQLLMEAKQQLEDTKSNDPTKERAELSDDDLLAQCLLFFFAGFETVSTCLCFTLYELLMNQDVQQRLYEEISEMEEELDGKPLNYNALMNMKLLEMVVSESLRMWPPVLAVDRLCSADYKLMNDDGNVLAEIKKDDMIFIPTVCLHRDPENFSDPDKFVPERFSDENKANIKPLTYIPFGVGPRNCIANRLALMEVKSIIYHIVLKFKVTATEKTSKDMMNSIRGFQMAPKELFWTKFIPRDN